MRVRSFIAVVVLTGPLAAACSSTAVEGPHHSGGATTSTSDGGGGAATTTSSGTGGELADAGPDVDNGAPSDVYPAFEPETPKAVSYGGPVLKAPKIVPVYFSNDVASLTDMATDFYSKIGGTEYWKATTDEYGVGAATSLPPIQLAEAAPAQIDDVEIDQWIAGKLNGDDPAFPVADDDTVYVLHYPSTTTITFSGGGGASCVSFGGYHSNTTLDATHGAMDVAYAVIPRCSDFAGLNGIDAVTAAASHELVEAATDPFPMTNPAYAMIDTNHLYWLRVLGGGETGDLCAQQDASFTKFAELDYIVQRSWSNKLAKAWHDPCQPAIDGAPYFNAAPVLPDSITAKFGPQTFQVDGVKLGLGETRDVEIDLFSDAKTDGPWLVEAHDVRTLLGQEPGLDLALDRSTGVNGEKLHLTITVLTEGKNKTESFLLVSTLGKQKNLWIGIVGST